MTAQEKLNEEKPVAEEENPAEEEKEVADEPIKESVEDDNRVNLIEAENLLLKAEREATPERIKAVAAVPEDDRQALVESWPQRGGVARPESSPPKYTHGNFEIPKDTKKFAAWLR